MKLFKPKTVAGIMARFRSAITELEDLSVFNDSEAEAATARRQQLQQQADNAGYEVTVLRYAAYDARKQAAKLQEIFGENA